MNLERLKNARLACGLSLNQVALKIQKSGCNVTRAAISNYEIGKRVPNASILRSLASVYGVHTGYFFEKPAVNVEWFSFRAGNALSAAKRESVKAYSAKEAEKYVLVNNLIPHSWKADIPARRKVECLSDADTVASGLRKRWKLGKDPIESVTQCFESHGILVVHYNKEPTTAFDGLSARINAKYPLVIVNSRVPVDRLRFDLLHELGHIVMDSNDDDNLGEKLAHRFAASFLVPPEKVIQELGGQRHNLTLSELLLLKEKYGLSVAAWLYAALAHEVINKTLSCKLWSQLKERGWREKEPDVFTGNEEPIRLKMTALRAVSEGIINARKVVQWFPDLEDKLKAEGLLVESEVERIRKLPKEERAKVLKKSAAKAADAYRKNKDLIKPDSLTEEFWDA